MKKFKRLVSVVALAGIMGSLAVGCGSPEESKDKSSGDKQALEIYIAGYESDPYKGLYDNAIEGFEKENPSVDVQVVPAGWEEATSKLMSLIQANETPDVIMTGSRNLRQFAEMGVIEQLDQYMTDEFKAGRVDSVLNTANIDGKQYGIPLAFSSRALYYRTDLVQTPPKTWDELVATAKQVQEQNPSIKGFGLATDSTAVADLLNFFYQNGGRMVDDQGNYTLNSEENVKTLEFLTKMYKEDQITPNPVDTKRSDLATMFKNGQIAMFISGPWESATLGEYGADSTTPYGVALLPAGSQMAETLVTDSYSISANSENKELAWDLIEFLGKYEYQNAYDEKIGFFPILKEEESAERYTTEFMKPFSEMIQYGVAEPQVPVWDTFEDALLNAVKKCMMGEATAKEALDQAQTEATQK